MRVLVIDDDPNILLMLEMVFELEGFEVVLAEDGPDGLEAAKRCDPDVIVLDVMMPGLDGWDVAAELARQPELVEVPIVFCTAKSDERSTWKGWQLGAASYVPKPFDTTSVVEVVLGAVRDEDEARTLITI